ncbi:MAG: class I SAM-dependent methyltransferase [Geothrix sp.]|uniref:16S rRNA (guanine(527)-N(7))-methyltransferase RsmG n=1 Tax=Geothrix sp. TaxID=1962974 RepID=UPI0018423133|nr:RsmG family class I SAM-dependent methyltransferase [Geothrix sp.]NWJ40326.1 class I SAM-dependent methyltransferase [Geothrix sp.]WIL21668.1 MAG: class I SAM-dependent methyltransferase [Geothrix sp.]
MELRLPSELNAPLGRFLVLLDKWNRTHALTALPPGERREELLLDAAALLPSLAPLPAGAKVADLGTGMGCPAVVLALARPDLQVLGVDASTKKLAFLRQVAMELPVPNLKAVHGRLEDLPDLDADWGTAKALAPLGSLVAWWERHGKPEAPFFALKGPDWEAEPMPGGWIATPHPYALPTRGRRVMVEIRRDPGGG